MNIFVPNQTDGGEARVALVPAVVKKLAGGGATVMVQASAGAAAGYDDEAFRAAGAQIASADAWGAADIALVVAPPAMEHAMQLRAGALLAGLLSPHRNLELIQALAGRGVSAIALEYLPRISRAQAMDALSSQANLAGYKAAVIGAERCAKAFPMLMTAAGTIQPAKVFVIGAGVAGLQAIATARRLGAIVSAFDLRPAVKEQVQSVGARFIELPMEASEAAGGYAKELTPQQQEKQRELMAAAVIEADVVIATAAVPEKLAPRLISAELVARMRIGSVIVDLAAGSGGNCELTEADKVVVNNGVTIVGMTNLPATVPFHASQVYANNLAALLKVIVSKEGKLALDTTDELIAASLLCHGGQVVHPHVKELMGHA